MSFRGEHMQSFRDCGASGSASRGQDLMTMCNKESCRTPALKKADPSRGCKSSSRGELTRNKTRVTRCAGLSLAEAESQHGWLRSWDCLRTRYGRTTAPSERLTPSSLFRSSPGIPSPPEMTLAQITATIHQQASRTKARTAFQPGDL